LILFLLCFSLKGIENIQKTRIFPQMVLKKMCF
jgi:hypothetical protein